MNKRLSRVISLIVLLPIVVIFGYLALSQWNKFHIFQQYYISATETLQGLSRMDDNKAWSIKMTDVDEWNRKASKKLGLFYASYDKVDHKEVIDSIEYTKALLQEVFALRLNYAEIVEPLQSKRMLDINTMQDEKEYNWRMEELDTIYQYILDYQETLNLAIDNFRQSIVASHWDERYRQYAWQKWGSGIKSQLIKLLPESTKVDSDITKYQRFFHHMYKNRDVYYVNNKGEIIFSHQRYLKESIRHMNSMGPEYQKYGVSNVLN